MKLKIRCLESIIFAKQELITRAKLLEQGLATGENFSFNQCHYKEYCVFFFSGKLIYKINGKLFSCICIDYYKHSIARLYDLDLFNLNMAFDTNQTDNDALMSLVLEADIFLHIVLSSLLIILSRIKLNLVSQFFTIILEALIVTSKI